MNSIKYKTNNAILALLLKQKELEDVKQEVGLVPNGDSYETHAGKFFTTEDVITLRDKVTVGLGSSKFTGIVAKNYDGLNDGLLVFDADGYARVGDEGKLQMIATREDVPLANGIAYYDDHTRKFKTKAESALSVANANKLAGVEATNYARTDTDETFDTKVWIGGQIAASEAKLQVNGFMRTGDIYIHTGGSTPNNDRTNDALHNSIGTLKWRDNTVWTAGNANLNNVNWQAKTISSRNGGGVVIWEANTTRNNRLYITSDDKGALFNTTFSTGGKREIRFNTDIERFAITEDGTSTTGHANITENVTAKAFNTTGTLASYNSTGGLAMAGLAGDTFADISAYSDAAGTGKNLALQKEGGKVGIGTTAPIRMLDVVYNDSSTALGASSGTAWNAGLQVANSSSLAGSYAFIDLRASSGDVRLASVYGGDANSSDFVLLTDNGGLNEHLRIASTGKTTFSTWVTAKTFRSNTSNTDWHLLSRTSLNANKAFFVQKVGTSTGENEIASFYAGSAEAGEGKIALGVTDSGIKAYYSGAKKFETTNTGATTTGNHYITNSISINTTSTNEALNVTGNATLTGGITAKSFKAISTNSDWSLIARDATGAALYVNSGASTGDIATFRYGSMTAGTGTRVFDISVSGTTTTGNSTVIGDHTVTSALFLTDTGTKLTQYNINGGLNIDSPTGQVSIGSLNASHTHFITDRPSYYFNKALTAIGGFSIYAAQTGLSESKLTLNTGHYLQSVGTGIKHFGDTMLTGYTGSSTYVSGIAGSGWRISQEARAEFTNLDIRESLICNTFTNNKINISNGDLIVSDTDTVEEIIVSGTNTILYFSVEQPFQVGDILRCQGSKTAGNIKSYYVTVTTIGTSGTVKDEFDNYKKYIYYTTTSKTGTGTAETGDVLVRWNSSIASRKGLLFLSSSSTYAPFYDVVYDGVTKARYGNLGGITSPTWGNLTSYGLWSDNVYLEGSIKANRGQIGGWTIDPANGGQLSNSTGNILLRGEGLYNSEATGNILIGNWSTGSRPTMRVVGNATGNYVEMFYASPIDWGLAGKDSSGSTVFQLGSSNKIAGWNITSAKIWTGTESAGDIEMNKASKRFLVRKDTSNYVNMHYTGSSDWGIRGRDTDGVKFELGSTNQIASWTFTNNYLKHSTGSKHITISNSETDATSHAGARRGFNLYNDNTTLIDANSTKIIQIGMLCNKDSANSFPATPNYGMRIVKGNGTYKDIFRADATGALIAGWNFNDTKLYNGNTFIDTVNGIGVNDGTSRWNLKPDGSGSLAAGAISWTTAGVVTLTDAVKIAWNNVTDTENIGNRVENGIVVIPRPVGGAYSGSGTVTGAIKISLPQSWTSTMLSFTVDIYNYSTGTSRSIKIGGYNYGGSSTWHNTSANTSGTTAGDNRIRFGHDGTKCCIYIGESTTNWSYPKVVIRDFQAGHSNASVANWNNDWVVGITSTIASNIDVDKSVTLSDAGDTLTVDSAKVNGNTLITNNMIRTSLLNATEVRAVVVTAEAVNAVTINASSITTGTLSANRISTGSLNADKITAGTITATQINATSIAAATVTADNINSISLTSTQGSIGGWDINTTAIKKGTYASSGTPTLAINSVNSGSGSFYNGGQKLAGYGMYWYRSSNAGHIVLGQVASNGSTIKTGYYGIQMMDWTGLEHFCLSAGTATSGSRPVYNRIGGWSFDSNSIYSGTSKDISGYATSGLTLYSGGSLHAKQFYIDTSGNAFFKGNITGASGTFSGKLSANSGSIGGLTISGNTLYAGSTSSNRYIKLEAKADGTGYIDIRGTSSSTNLLYIQGGRMQHQAGIFYAADTYLRGDTQAWTGIDFTYGAVRTSTNVGTRIEATGIQGAGVKNPTWSTSSGSPTLLSVTATSGSTKFGNVYFLDESSGSKKYVRLPYTSGVLDGTTIRIGSRGRDINIVANSSSQLGWNDSSPTSSGTYSLTEENRWTLWIKFGNAWWLAHNQNL